MSALSDFTVFPAEIEEETESNDDEIPITDDGDSEFESAEEEGQEIMIDPEVLQELADAYFDQEAEDDEEYVDAGDDFEVEDISDDDEDNDDEDDEDEDSGEHYY